MLAGQIKYHKHRLGNIINKIFLSSFSSSHLFKLITFYLWTKQKVFDLIEEKKKSDNMGLRLNETFYLSHGSPALAVDDSIPARKFFTSWKERFPAPPSAILVVSGHWDTHVPTVNVVDRNDTIYDFYGFPESMYKVCLLLWFIG